MSASSFGLVDYAVFVLVLSLSAVIGIYFGCYGTKQKTATEYMYGKGKGRAVPIGLSIYSSAVSAILIIGAPIEIYSFGTQFIMIYLGNVLSIVIAWVFVLPVFCGKLDLKTPYEYFERRFNYSVRALLTTIHVLDMLLFIPVVLYCSVVVFSEATNLNLTLCISVIGGVCIIYTMMGGFSAVIWSDAFQATLMMGSVIFVLVRAIINVGGISEIWDRAEKGGRINFFIMDPNPFRRLSFWSASFGNMITFAGHSYCSASCIQRFLALKKEKDARISTSIGCSLSTIFGVLVSFIGLAMYAQYYNCDPIKNKKVSAPNKLLPYFVTQLVEDLPGFLGLFNAGLLSAGLSTMSAELNTLSGLIYHCFIQKIWRRPYGEREGAVIMKIIVLCFGILCLSIAPIVDRAKYIFSIVLISIVLYNQLSISPFTRIGCGSLTSSISGITFGLKVALVLLGTAFPRTNSLGAFIGTLLSGIIFIWLQIGSLFYNVAAPEVLPLSVANCTQNNFNITEILSPPKSFEEPPILYKLSFMLYAMFSAVLTIIISLIVSYFSGMNNVSEMNPYMFIPWLRPKGEEDKKCETELLNCNN